MTHHLKSGSHFRFEKMVFTISFPLFIFWPCCFARSLLQVIVVLRGRSPGPRPRKSGWPHHILLLLEPSAAHTACKKSGLCSLCSITYLLGPFNQWAISNLWKRELPAVVWGLWRLANVSHNQFFQPYSEWSVRVFPKLSQQKTTT